MRYVTAPKHPSLDGMIQVRGSLHELKVTAGVFDLLSAATSKLVGDLELSLMSGEIFEVERAVWSIDGAACDLDRPSAGYG